MIVTDLKDNNVVL